jgi:hypothetical protein
VTDSQFLRHLENTGKITWYLFGSVGMWKINDTCLTLEETQRLKDEDHCCSSESDWYLVTTRFFIVIKMSGFGIPLEEFWNGLNFEECEEKGKKLDEWFKDTPDF